MLTSSEQADRSRTRRRPDFGRVNAIARPLVTGATRVTGNDEVDGTIAFGYRGVNRGAIAETTNR